MRAATNEYLPVTTDYVHPVRALLRAHKVSPALLDCEVLWIEAPRVVAQMRHLGESSLLDDLQDVQVEMGGERDGDVVQIDVDRVVRIRVGRRVRREASVNRSALAARDAADVGELREEHAVVEVCVRNVDPWAGNPVAVDETAVSEDQSAMIRNREEKDIPKIN